MTSSRGKQLSHHWPGTFPCSQPSELGRALSLTRLVLSTKGCQPEKPPSCPKMKQELPNPTFCRVFLGEQIELALDCSAK